jgi:hypothetical protein
VAVTVVMVNVIVVAGPAAPTSTSGHCAGDPVVVVVMVMVTVMVMVVMVVLVMVQGVMVVVGVLVLVVATVVLWQCDNIGTSA